jgi:GcrA cell cycle regulator
MSECLADNVTLAKSSDLTNSISHEELAAIKGICVPKHGNLAVNRSAAWTDETISVLRERGQELSGYALALEISKITGLTVTRSAVVGKMMRLGIPLRDAATALKSRKAPTLRPKPQRPPMASHISAARMISIDELTRRDCRWPIGDPRKEDFGFCGHAVMDGKSYCAGHQAIAYRPTEPMAKK